MSTSKISEKKIFLIVSEDSSRLKSWRSSLEKRASSATIYEAADGLEGLNKALNVPPHVLITDWKLSKRSGEDLLASLKKNHRFNQTAFLVADHPPESEKFVDEIVTGQVQFIGNEYNETDFGQALTRALNFAANGEQGEFNVRFLAAGDRLIKQGDKAESVYILKRGKLQASVTISEKQTVLGTIEVGEFVGEMAYINGEPRSADVAALTDCELIEIPVGTIEMVLYKRPAWAKTMMSTLSKRLKRANEIKSKKS